MAFGPSSNCTTHPPLPAHAEGRMERERESEMAKRVSDEVLNIRLGALYRMAVINSMSRDDVRRYMVSRCGMSSTEAELLSSHWFRTGLLRGRAA
jgi:hypothetical protein